MPITTSQGPVAPWISFEFFRAFLSIDFAPRYLLLQLRAHSAHGKTWQQASPRGVGKNAKLKTALFWTGRSHGDNVRQ
jgi:hypothetical protein